MAMRKLLLLLKPFDAFRARQGNSFSDNTNAKMLHHLENRLQVHKEAINFCQNVLQRKLVYWEPLFRHSLSEPIHDIDLVVTVGGDGTLLQASHFMDDSVPVLGVNSDPTHFEEVEEFSNDFDATRSTGYLCAATVKNFEQVLDDILENRTAPDEISRISVCINSEKLPTHPLNDLLIAHPCPATVSRFSLRITKDQHPCMPLVNCRSSGLRVCTAAGSTAAMLSAGGFEMPILSKDLQYMVREPITPNALKSSLMHGLVGFDETFEIAWSSIEGAMYIDGSHVSYSIQQGDVIEISSRAPLLRIFLPPHSLSQISYRKHP
ncbi:hypothetical protein Nepgr_007411 [Nepenthes gracilis]|uniref:NADH kinase n=1 Tax=Nepenthes gracilis TaxID=150966 RepID=A0AAD3S7K1_NEPGR|nr:hypothetical protein Nepgr_007411 [Nepenthes gracilis]